MVAKFQVFKKSSLSGKLTLYLTKRDYLDHGDHAEPIEGVLLLDPNYVGTREVFVELALSFRFGRESDESYGYNFIRTIYLETTQIYPPKKDIMTTILQRGLISKLGNFAFPFRLEFPKLASPSYQMQQGWEDEGSLIGMEYEVVAFIGTSDGNKKHSTANILIRRLMEIPPEVYEGPTPSGTITKSFLTCSGTITIEATIGRRVFRPDDEIAVKLSISNKCSREVKRLKVKLVQISEVPVFSKTQKREQTLVKIDEAVFIPTGSCTAREYELLAAVPPRQARGVVFLQGTFRPDIPPILAASTILREDVVKKDVFGIIVSYAVRIKATLGPIFGDVILDVPFTLEAPYE